MSYLPAAPDPQATTSSRGLGNWLNARVQRRVLSGSTAEWMWQFTNMPLSLSLTAIAIAFVTRLFRSS